MSFCLELGSCLTDMEDSHADHVILIQWQTAPKHLICIRFVNFSLFHIRNPSTRLDNEKKY